MRVSGERRLVILTEGQFAAHNDEALALPLRLTARGDPMSPALEHRLRAEPRRGSHSWEETIVLLGHHGTMVSTTT